MVNSLKKIIYFDETSAMDLLQIERKGNFNKTVELMTAIDVDGQAKANASVDVDKPGAVKMLFDKVTGMSGTFQGNLGINGDFQGNRIAKTILENSLLYDFLHTVEYRKRKPLVDIVDGFELSIKKDSMTYYAMIAPMTEMMEGNQYLDESSDITMSVSKLNVGIKNSKGYFDLVGSKGKVTRVFRFNIEAFRNNYRIQDLRKMNLTLYSVCVGETTIAELKFETEFELENKDNEIGFQGFDAEEGTDYKQDENKKVFVYDVILAGVK